MQQERSHLPIKLNTAGVIPPIFASSLLLMPLTVLQMGWCPRPRAARKRMADHDLHLPAARLARLSGALRFRHRVLLLLLHGGAVQFSEETAENLKRHGGFIPGIRPGKATELYFDYLLNRITVIGAAYLAIICLIPEFLSADSRAHNFRLGGTSLLIVVNVTMDTVSQIQSHLIAHQYGDLIKKAKLKDAAPRAALAYLQSATREERAPQRDF